MVWCKQYSKNLRRTSIKKQEGLLGLLICSPAFRFPAFAWRRFLWWRSFHYVLLCLCGFSSAAAVLFPASSPASAAATVWCRSRRFRNMVGGGRLLQIAPRVWVVVGGSRFDPGSVVVVAWFWWLHSGVAPVALGLGDFSGGVVVLASPMMWGVVGRC
ncbi:hypothetical protein QL285_088645 [Trifolium repens]|nr:hypothetical protein QL285_088645 [Trifolium repens]